MSAALALARAECAGVRFLLREGGTVRLEAPAAPPKYILDELRRYRQDVKALLAERAARAAFYLRAIEDSTVASAIPDPDLARERAQIPAESRAKGTDRYGVPPTPPEHQPPFLGPYLAPVCDVARRRVREAAEATWSAFSCTKATVVVSTKPQAAVVQSDAFTWMAEVAAADTIHAVVADPPYGLIEYDERHHTKMREGRAGVWRHPPAFDGSPRSPIPRFTVLTEAEHRRLGMFFGVLGREVLRVLVPGGHLIMASHPLLSSEVFAAMQRAGLEKRGEIIRLVQTLRGGDRPKGAETEFPDVNVMPRSAWEPWGLFRKPLSEKTVAANLRRWGTGGLRRVSLSEPFRDVISSAPARDLERTLAPHPSLKPQRFVRQIVRAALPLAEGLVYDPFLGGGSTLAAAHRLALPSIGTEVDSAYATMAIAAIPRLSALELGPTGSEEYAGRR